MENKLQQAVDVVIQYAPQCGIEIGAGDRFSKEETLSWVANHLSTNGWPCNCFDCTSQSFGQAFSSGSLEHPTAQQT